jgi:hypothetical protein
MDLQARYAAIQQKEEELRNRESALRKQDVSLDAAHPPNFPPFYPMMYHNIAEEIPIAMQLFLKVALVGIITILVNSFVNLIACCASKPFVKEKKMSEVVSNVIGGAIIALLTGPLAFRVTYMREYEQCKKNEITLWTMALQALLLVWVGLCSVGVVWGTIGVVRMLDAVGSKANGFTKAIAVISTALWLLITALELFLLGRLLLLFKASGQRLETAPAGGYAPGPDQ